MFDSPNSSRQNSNAESKNPLTSSSLAPSKNSGLAVTMPSTSLTASLRTFRVPEYPASILA